MMIELVLLGFVITILLYVYNEFRAHYYIKSPMIYCKDTKLHKELLIKCLRNPFIPTFWAANNHCQTWLRTFLNFSREPKLNVTREYIEMYDKGIISLDWINIDKAKPIRKTVRRKSVRQQEKPILLIIPSAINTRVHDYSNLCLQAVRKGFKPVFYNRRGYSQTPLTTPKVVTYCDRSDLDDVLEYITNQNPFSHIVSIGFSMESSNLISCLGNGKLSNHISGGVCISSTFGCENLLNDSGIKEPYNFVITEKLKSIFLSQQLLGTEVNFEKAKESKNIVEVQGNIHARSNHYKNLKEYLEYNNTLAHLKKVNAPLLFINAKDDPITPDQCIPFPFFKISDYCILLTTEYGGHCGFFERIRPHSWSGGVALEFLKIILLNRRLIPQSNGFTRNRSLTTGCI